MRKGKREKKKESSPILFKINILFSSHRLVLLVPSTSRETGQNVGKGEGGEERRESVLHL